MRIAAAVASVALLAALSGCTAPAAANPFVGTWGDTGAASQPSLVLTSDGKVSGTDGCNSLSGTFTEANGVATFGALASTLMACPDVTTWLGAASTAKVTGAQLVISDSSGTEIGTLPKTG